MKKASHLSLKVSSTNLVTYSPLIASNLNLKMKSIIELKTLTTQKGVRESLGLVGYIVIVTYWNLHMC